MGPVIASIRMGAERLFRLKGQDGTITFPERLSHGRLFIMAGNTQKTFKHEVPKELDVNQPRINLTFRRIEHR
jgi:alkylated DNA repair dioxygenase AlkB